tara:strand:+ start:54 stop:3554 length:3501 start_codon:yes stop_codon:yes gene_type:complete
MSEETSVFTDKNALTEYLNVDENELKTRVQRLGDAVYISQTTGIGGRELEAAKQRLGIFDWTGGTESVNDLLATYGYQKGNNTDYYTNADFDPVDQGAAVLSEQYQKAALVEAKIEAEYQKELLTNPDAIKPHLVSNDYGANSAFLADYAATQVDFITNAIVKPANADVTAEADTKLNELTKNNSFYTAFGKPASETLLNMREWDAYLAEKPKEKIIPTTTLSGQPVTVQEVAQAPTPTTTPAKVLTADPETLKIDSESVTPYFNPANTTPTATTTTPAEQFDAGITRQGTAFAAREAEQAKFYQPQTLTEKKEAGVATSTSSILTQKLYRNPITGHQLYIPFYGDQPASPIPVGYYSVDMSGGTAGNISLSAYNPVTAGGNTYDFKNSQYMAKGGMIQGYQEGNLVNPPINFKPGGTVKPVDVFNPALNTTEIKFQIQYPGSKDAEGKDIPGGVSQFYDEMTQAEQAQSLGLKNLGIPDYNTYLSNIGVNTSLPGYDPASYTSQYQQYITDPTNFAKLPAEQTGTVSFQDPVSGQVVSQNVPEYIQTQQNIAAQKTVNPGATIAPMGVQYMAEYGQDAEGNVFELMPGTTIESTAGRAIPTAPVIAGDEVAQVSDVTQSTGAVNPGAAQMNLTQGAPTVLAQDFSPATQQVPAKDPQGNILRDADGNVIMVSAPTQQITAQQQVGSSIGQPLTDAQGNVLRDAEGNVIFNVAGETGTATAVSAPTDRTLQRTRVPLKNQDGTVVRDTEGNIMYQDSELISGSTVDTSKVGTAFGTEQVTAASITGELATLMKDFEGGDTPAWAAGAMRQATAIMNERGLGASTMAGQAIVQAAMESALPIAQVEAGNKQQIALFNAQQRANFLKLDFDQAFQAKVQNAARISEIANMNFSADQTIALENSRATNTMNLNNLSNKQAVTMAEAASLSQLDMANLNNRQQANVQNAQNFLQLDMANLSNTQQSALFKQQSLVNSILSDAGAANAAAQFNATSENQTNQFFSNLSSQVSQFNAAQKNAIDQFNAEEANAVLEFNSALQNQREMFNAQNYLVVAQANAAWRQGINTANTEAQNLSNAQYAKDVNGLSQQALDNFWQKERDLMNFAFAEGESQKDRALRILLGEADEAFAREQLDLISQENKTAFFMDLFLPKDFSLTDIFSLGNTKDTS